MDVLISNGFAISGHRPMGSIATGGVWQADPMTRHCNIEIYSPKWFFPQSRIFMMTSFSVSPLSVREYSTFGGTCA